MVLNTLDPYLRMYLGETNKRVSRSCYGKRGYARLDDVCFRARRLSAAEPVRKAHREKRRESVRGKLAFP